MLDYGLAEINKQGIQLSPNKKFGRKSEGVFGGNPLLLTIARAKQG